MKISVARLFISLLIFSVSYLLFEFQNVWPFNQETVPLLRGIFLVCLFCSLIGVFLNRTWFAVAPLGLGFIITTVLSNAAITTTFVLAVLGAVVALWATIGLRSS